VIDNAHSARLVPAGDEDPQVVFTHPGCRLRGAGMTDTVLIPPLPGNAGGGDQS
jgi:hypothetical protein